MPWYDYECTNPKCKHTFDIIQTLSEPVITVCPKCHQNTCKKVLKGAPLVQFKGDGWTPNHHG